MSGKRIDVDAPLVSVVMSVYNAEQFLASAIESILGQTLRDFEFIIIDDGSTDNSFEIAARYQDSRIVLSRNLRNCGQAEALNAGISKAIGRYIARMDADDISMPNRFERQVTYFEEHPDLGVLSSQMITMDLSGETTGFWRVPCAHSMIAWSIFFYSPLAHPAVMIRRALLVQFGGYDPLLAPADDLGLWARLMMHTHMANLPDSLMRYRVHPSSLSRRKATIQRDNTLLIRQRLAADLLQRDLPLELFGWAEHAQQGGGLAEEKVASVVCLLLDVYQAMLNRGLILPEEAELTRNDLAKRIIATSRCVRERSAVLSIGRTYWHSIAPRGARRTVTFIYHLASKILHIQNQAQRAGKERAR